MPPKNNTRLLIFFTTIFMILYFINQRLEFSFENQNDDEINLKLKSQVELQKIHIALVGCQGSKKDSVGEIINLIKSAVLFTSKAIHFTIFTDQVEDFQQRFKESFPADLLQNPVHSNLDQNNKENHTLHVQKINYQNFLNKQELDEFKNWWAPCASYRLFLPEIFQNFSHDGDFAISNYYHQFKLDQKVIYLDSDTLFLSDPFLLWENFNFFNEKQVGALAPRIGRHFRVPAGNENYILYKQQEQDLENNRSTATTTEINELAHQDPYQTQVNSGVFLMDLQKMRQNIFNSFNSQSSYSWNKDLFFNIYNRFNSNMHGDQDLINIIFHFNPDLIYFISCKFNYHHKFCFSAPGIDPARNCDAAEAQGAFIVHGSAKCFQNNYAPAFRAVNQGFRDLDLVREVEEGGNVAEKNSLTNIRSLRQRVKSNIKHNLEKDEIDKHPHCGGRIHVFTGNFHNL